jgi:hypothetical protein
VKVMLRPEWLTVTFHPPGDAWVSVPVRVRERIYQGAVTRWVVEGLGPAPLEVCGTPAMSAHEAGSSVLDDVPPGHDAYLSWRRGMGVVLPGAAA